MNRTLNEWLAWQEKSHPKAWDLGLERIGTVWQRLNPKNEKIASHIITIAGTNGKGSCVRWVENICWEHGVSIAAFSSPHLRDYRERIRFNGENVSAADLVAAFNAIDVARGDISLTYFEWSALAMFYLTHKKGFDVAVLEVGLGGRLDATNLIDADVAIITRIGLDHQDWLGNDRETIGREKAGIMRKNQRVFITDENPPASLAECAAEIGAVVSWFGRDFSALTKDGQLEISFPTKHFHLPLPVFMTGKHQFAHLAAVIYALSLWFHLDKDHLIEVVKKTKNDGRLMLIKGNPRILLDVAHNPDSAEILADYLSHFDRRGGRILAVCGMLKDKDQITIFKTISPMVDRWFLAALDGTRGTNMAQITENAQAAGINQSFLQTFTTVASALNTARQKAQVSDTIVIFGSFVTVSAALEELDL